MTSIVFRGNCVLPERVQSASLVVCGDTIASLGPIDGPIVEGAKVVDAGDGFIVPGFIDLHVHGGGGGDFMDGTVDSFTRALQANVRHGTTRMAITTTVATHEQILATLQLTRQFRLNPLMNGSRVLGAHFYGPYFRYEAKGAHPGAPIRPPVESEFVQYLDFAEDLVTATIAPEVAGAKEFVLACAAKGVRTNVGHSWATFDQMRDAVEWGVRHVDHLYCAMSDKSKLRQFQPFPMQAGVLEATLYFDELTTEVITDGIHLDAGLLLLALKIKGPDRLALVTDCSRALDMPDGNYMIGPQVGGEPIMKRNGAGLMPDGKGLASSVAGMDEMVKTFLRLTNRPLYEVIRMASLTPARIAGYEQQFGSLEVGKRADIILMDRDLNIKEVFIDGKALNLSNSHSEVSL
jgi:N-acetylglucosamine-6-phosphate deacetylase